MVFGTILGICSILLTFVFITIAILLRTYTKLKISIRIFEILLGLFGLVYFIVFRYINDVLNLINNNLIDPSIYYSKVLLLDLCPFMYVLLNINLIFNIKKQFIKTSTLWSIIGSTITIIGAIWDAETTDPLRYIFVTSPEGNLYFFIHIYMLLFGAFFFVYYNRHNFINVIIDHVFVSIYLIYVFIIVKTLNITRNATGLVEFDWMDINGEYHAVYLMLKLPYPNIMYLSYFLVWIEMVVLIVLRNSFSKPTLKWFWPKKFYIKIKFLNELSTKWYKYRMKNKHINNI